MSETQTEQVLVVGGPMDGKIATVPKGAKGVRFPMWNGRDFYTDDHPTMPIYVPALGEVEYHRTAKTDGKGRAVFE